MERKSFMSDPGNRGFDLPRHFDAKKAGAYDEVIPRIIPGYDILHRVTSNIVEIETGGQGRVLVIGAGTGTDAINLCRSHPGLSATGCDPSADMLAVAKRKIAEEGLEDRIDLKQGDVGELPDNPVFDAATMILVMHFIADGGGKKKLLDAVATRLKPGAPLVLADMFGNRDSPEYKDQETNWRNLQITAGIDPQDVDKSIRHAAKDTYPITEYRLSELLDESGFEVITPFFRSLMFGGWLARKKTG
jgi:tRNA (cmo5U34)-methyltransferase